MTGGNHVEDCETHPPGGDRPASQRTAAALSAVVLMVPERHPLRAAAAWEPHPVDTQPRL